MATAYLDSILRLINSIPLQTYNWEEVLAESRPDRRFFGKWDHSLIVFDGTKPVAVLIAYERKAEVYPGYWENSIYISELAVDENCRRQGIARQMLKIFFQQSQSFLYLKGKPVYTIQTNSATWNEPVRRLYESFGYKTVATKDYSNRVDVIMKK